MQLDETARRVIDQFLQARLHSAQASLEGARQIEDGVLSVDATRSFMNVADLLRRWHDLEQSSPPTREHRGKLLMQYLQGNSQFVLDRRKKLPLLLGDELAQTRLITDLWKEFFFTIKLIPVRISQRGDRLALRFDYKRLPPAYHQAFSHKNSTSWLLSNLTLQNLTAWLWQQELLQAGIRPSAITTQPQRFSLNFTVVTQLTLPLE